MQVGFMMQKALGELFILKSTKPLPIIFKACFDVCLLGLDLVWFVDSTTVHHCEKNSIVLEIRFMSITLISENH